MTQEREDESKKEKDDEMMDRLAKVGSRLWCTQVAEQSNPRSILCSGRSTGLQTDRYCMQ